MEPLPDVGALRPILVGLKNKGLVLELTPEGRGQIVSHNLYKERELAELRARTASLAGDSSLASDVAETTSAPGTSALPAPPRAAVTLDMFNELQLEVAELRAEVARLRSAVQQLTSPS
jgi:hypothetical protein